MKGAANLIPDILEHSNLTGLPTYVLNDAELAAVAARALVKENTEPILVITVGFGIGAAVALRVPNEINP
jgi:predicted NBD/HSP70 family sugar kinase